MNRVWSNFFGRGLVDPDDDLRVSNPPSDEALLDWLVADFIAHHYDIKHMIRTIMSSAVYARSSLPVPGNEADTKFLSHYRVKRLPAEVLLDAIARVTEVPTPFNGYPAGWRSIQLPDSKVENTFLESFGRPARLATCSCERSAEPSMAQALHLANGKTINDKLRSDSSALAKAIARNDDDSAIVDRLFLSSLCRPPTPAEKEPDGESPQGLRGGAERCQGDRDLSAPGRRGPLLGGPHLPGILVQSLVIAIEGEVRASSSRHSHPRLPPPTGRARPRRQAPARADRVSFRDTVAPLLVKKCLGCHGERKASGGLNMATFTAFKRGGKVAGDDDPRGRRSGFELPDRVDRAGGIAEDAVQASAPLRGRDRHPDAVGQGGCAIRRTGPGGDAAGIICRRAGRSAQDRLEGPGRRSGRLGGV